MACQTCLQQVTCPDEKMAENIRFLVVEEPNHSVTVIPQSWIRHGGDGDLHYVWPKEWARGSTTQFKCAVLNVHQPHSSWEPQKIVRVLKSHGSYEDAVISMNTALYTPAAERDAETLSLSKESRKLRHKVVVVDPDDCEEPKWKKTRVTAIESGSDSDTETGVGGAEAAGSGKSGRKSAGKSLEAMENENTTVFRSVRRRLQARSSGRKIEITVAEIKKAVETHGMTYTAVEGFLRTNHAKRKELHDELRAHGVVLHNGRFEENPLAMLTGEEAGEVLDAIKIQMAKIPSEGLKETLLRRIEASVDNPDLVPVARKVVSDVCSVIVMATEDESLKLFGEKTNGLGTGIFKCLMNMVKDMVDEQG